MSATLTWNVTGPGTKGGTTNTDFYTDFKALIDSKSGDANYKWIVAGSNLGSSPRYLVLKRKDASVGRILICTYDSIPGTYPTVIFGSAPVANAPYIAWFPSGNVDTPGSLTANTAPLMGNDTGVVKAGNTSIISTVYGANSTPFYVDSAEGCLFFTGTPSATGYMMGAGDLVVDGNDVAYGAVISGADRQLTSFGAASSAMFGWVSSRSESGATNASCIRTNYGAADRQYFAAFTNSGWASETVTATTWLQDTATSKIWFIPCLLMSNATQPGSPNPRGEGMPLKLRQIAFGPGVLSGPIPSVSTTGPVVQATALTSTTAATTGIPWVVNFKL